jgi:hypothetical protein
MKGQVFFKGGNNHKNVKIGWGHLKIFSRIIGPILTRLYTNQPWKFVQMKGIAPLQGEIIAKE